MSHQQKLYKFRWTNYDLDRYVEERKSVAIGLRRQAADLQIQAQQIENEMLELKRFLVEHDTEERNDENLG